MSEGVHVYNTYQPWLDVDDDKNIFFASVQGYGRKSVASGEKLVPYPHGTLSIRLNFAGCR
jgi:hypothetical protein